MSSKQPPFSEVKARADELLPGMIIPRRIKHLRAFLEGAISYAVTDGDLWKAEHSYKKGSDHFNEWNAGWICAGEHLADMREPQFLKVCAGGL